MAAYIHTGAKVGVLVEVGAGKEATVANDEFKQLVRDITLQIAAAHPFAVTRDQVPAGSAGQGKGNRGGTGEEQAAASRSPKSSKASSRNFSRAIACWIRVS